jgi:hypothetical protein
VTDRHATDQFASRLPPKRAFTININDRVADTVLGSKVRDCLPARREMVVIDNHEAAARKFVVERFENLDR